MRNLPKLALMACVVAFLIGGGAMIGAALGEIVLLPAGLIQLIGGIGILRRRVWGAYGLALIYFAQLVPASLVVARRKEAGIPAEILAPVVFAVLLGCLYLF